MNRALIITIAVFLSFSMLSAQKISGRISTSAYAWEKYDTANQSDMLVRMVQTLQLEAAQGPVSFRTYLTGAAGSAGGILNDGRVRVYNAFFKWSNLACLADVNVGRIPVFAGVGIGTVDGLSFEGKALQKKLTFKGFGGMDVNPSLKGNGKLKENFAVGGQVAGWLTEKLRAGISYINRQHNSTSYYAIRPDSLYNPYTLLVNPPLRKEHLLGFDMLYDVNKFGTIYGRLDYDLLQKRALRGEVNIRADVNEKLSVTGTVIHREPRVFYMTIFSRLNSESVREYEGGLEYELCPWASSFGRFALVQYDDDNGKRLSAGISAKYGSLTAAWTDGAIGSLSSISIDGLYPIAGRMVVPTAGFSYSSYEYPGPTSKREDALSGILGVVVRPLKMLSFDLQVQWLKNRIYGHDVRAFGKMSYWFSHAFSKHQQKEGVK
jgi:hypothetical protein